MQRAQRLQLVRAELVEPLVEAEVERLDLPDFRRAADLGRRQLVDERIDLFLRKHAHSKGAPPRLRAPHAKRGAPGSDLATALRYAQCAAALGPSPFVVLPASGIGCSAGAVEDDDVDAAVLLAVRVGVVRELRVELAVARERDARRDDLLVFDQVAGDAGRARGRELPVGGILGGRDRHVVGAALDADRVAHVAELAGDDVEQLFRLGAQVGRSRVVVRLVAEQRDHQSLLVDARLHFRLQVLLRDVLVELRLHRGHVRFVGAAALARRSCRRSAGC